MDTTPVEPRTALHATRHTVMKGALVAAAVAGLGSRAIAHAASPAAPSLLAEGAGYTLSLGSSGSGLLRDASGGDPYAKVNVSSSPGGPVKSLAGPFYDDVIVSAGLAAPKAFYSSVAQALAGSGTAQTGVITTLDETGHAIANMAMSNALIGRITFPALRRSSTDPAALEAVYTPQKTTRTGTANPLKTYSGPQWSTGQFRLDIDSTPYPTVQSVEALTVKFPLSTDRYGSVVYQGPPECSDLVFTLPEADAAKTLQPWFDDTVLKGTTSARNGVLAYLDSIGGKPLFTLTLSQLGIYRLGSVAPGLVQAKLFCTSMSLQIASVVGV